jgi:hypothetical protein
MLLAALMVLSMLVRRPDRVRPHLQPHQAEDM